ncbi:Photosystem II reaction center W protein, chloroplastic [Hordeum vulgare]|nr:Photosystem II reaction center W protein, chloroplastic [Hordeum vulgare]
MPAIGATAVFVAARPPPRALGLPQLSLRAAGARTGRLRCSCYKDLKEKASSALALAVVKGAPLLAAASAMTAAAGPVLAPALALALVDGLVSAEGTGLGDDLLGWTLMVAFGLALSHTVYPDDDDDDDQSSAGGIAV